MNLKDVFKKGIPFSDMIEVSLAANAQGTAVITNQDGNDFIITEIANTSFVTANRSLFTKEFLFSMQDKGSNYSFSFKPIHAACLGTGKLPTRLTVPYILQGTADMQFALQNTSATPITVQIVVKGYKVPPNETVRKNITGVGSVFWDMFEIPLASLQSMKAIINNQDSRGFMIDELVGYVRNTAFAEVPSYFHFTLRDSATRNMLSGRPISGASLGNNEFPTKLDVPYPLRGRSQMECEASNDVTDSLVVYVILKGTKLAR